jgi:large-conductance mechanosensitive channel
LYCIVNNSNTTAGEEKLMSTFEAIMLLCFGISWPISIVKSLRTKVVTGKSPLFMVIVGFGYVSGVLHKIVYSFDWVIVLYIINFLMISIDLFLYLKYLPHDRTTQRRTPLGK